MRRAAWAVEERVVWSGANAARGVIDDAIWPFERLAWVLRRRVVWPIEDRIASWSRPARSGLALALLGLAGAAGLAGVQLETNGQTGPPAAEPLATAPRTAAPVSVELAKPTEHASHRVLRGSTPDFAPESDSASAAAAADKDTASAAVAAPPAPPTPAVSAPGEAPKAALKVARRFADAFVLYEIGEQDTAIFDVFRQTAADPLVKALAQRPPRQPAGVDVPKAKVLNVVAGPRRGDSLEVSASLLRVSDTSELRLHLEKTESGWLVTDVRG